MNIASGFISLHRSMLNWDWYDDIKTKTLFIHLLLTVNHIDGTWHGMKIYRGSRITSYQNLAKETGLTVREVRTALNKLKSTGELTCKSTHKYTLINVVNYSKFQNANFKNDTLKDTLKTHQRQQYNNKNNKNNIYIYGAAKNKFKNYSDRTEFTPEEEINLTKLIKKYGGNNDRYKDQ